MTRYTYSFQLSLDYDDVRIDIVAESEEDARKKLVDICKKSQCIHVELCR